MANARIFKVVLDTHTGLGHQGLSSLAKKAKINLDTLESGDLVMFMNKKGDKLKVLGAQGRVVGYLNLQGKKIMLESIQYLPATFGAAGFNYDDACKVVLHRRFGVEV